MFLFTEVNILCRLYCNHSTIDAMAQTHTALFVIRITVDVQLRVLTPPTQTYRAASDDIRDADTIGAFRFQLSDEI
jgi:hypothetical protein